MKDIQFFERSHRYKVGGEWYVSVTTALSVIPKPYLTAWRGRIGNDEADRVAEDAATHGTLVHDSIAALLLGQMEFQQITDPVARISVGVAMDWIGDNVKRVIHAERRLACLEHKFAGTVDLVAEMKDGSVALADWKTDKSGEWSAKKCEHAAQLAAYQMALEEDGLTIDRRFILQLPRNDPSEIVRWDYPHFERDRDIFLHCLWLYRGIRDWDRDSKKEGRAA
jgi:hypothetical protein